MPKIWSQGSYQKVENGLYKLRETDRSLYWHVCERYLRSRTATITIVHERKTARGSLKEPRRVVVETWDPKVQMFKVAKGIIRLSELIPGDLLLPPDTL